MINGCANVWAVANNLGLLYSHLNNLDGSVNMFEYGLKLKPNNRLLKANLGACYLEKGLIDKGTNLLYSARTLESFLTLGNYFLSVKNYNEAVKCYNRVLKIYPNNVEALAGKQAAMKNLKSTAKSKN
jgi:tetratricopeptide (TPR) repeat protein